MQRMNAKTWLILAATMVSAGGVIAQNCYTAVTLPCCTIATTPRCDNCTYDSNCCDILSGGGNVSHYKNNTPGGLPGNTGLTNGDACTCTVQERRCVNGYCVNDGSPFPMSATPSAPGGGDSCTTPNGTGGGGGEP